MLALLHFRIVRLPRSKATSGKNQLHFEISRHHFGLTYNNFGTVQLAIVMQGAEHSQLEKILQVRLATFSDIF